jgi:hypothetical protein
MHTTDPQTGQPIIAVVLPTYRMEPEEHERYIKMNKFSPRKLFVLVNADFILLWQERLLIK